jgi:hypothetical protein
VTYGSLPQPRRRVQPESLRRCRGKDKTPGRKRRWRREVQTKQSLAWLAALARGERVPCGRARLPYSFRALVHDYIADCPRGLLTMRAQARHLYELATKHGPASGWGVPQPPRDGAAAEHATPWWVPKAGEKCWRWWRHVVLELARLLQKIGSWLASLVPPHRTPLGLGHGREEAEPRASREHQGTTGCRDHGPSEVGRVPLSLRRLLGM